MKRLRLLFSHELRLFRVSVPLHMVVFLQPSILFWLITLVFVHPTLEMNLADSGTPQAERLAAAMQEIGVRDGDVVTVPYIELNLIDAQTWDGISQLVAVETRGSGLAAVQYYGYIDSNLVKNYRNRLTAAALRLWNAELGSHAITLIEEPWLVREAPFTLFFGMAMLPLAAFMTAALLACLLITQDYETGTILEYRLSPVSAGLVLGMRLLRLVLSSWLSAGLLLLAVGLRTGCWPTSILQVGLALLPIILTAACLGLIIGMLFRRFLPSFALSFIVTLMGWILGSAFGLAGGFGGWYAVLGRLVPNTYTVELLFPLFYNGIQVANQGFTIIVLICFTLVMSGLMGRLYHQSVRGQA